MRIALVQDYLRVGGTETQGLLMGKLWQEAGHQVHGIFFRRGGALDDPARSSGIEAHWLQPFPTPLNWWAPGLEQTLRRLAPDRIILLGRNGHTAFGRMLPRGELPGVIATMRTGRPLPAGYISVLRRAEATIANSLYGQKRALSIGCHAKCVQTIPNACRLTGIAIPSRGEARRTLGIGPEQPMLVCLASFVPGKNHRGMLQALAPLLNGGRVELWLVGDGPEKIRMERLSQKCNWAGCVRFTGNRSDVPTLLAAADLSILASHEESLPNALVESAWCGLPAVAYDVAGVREVIRPDQTGRVIPVSEAGAFLSAIQSYLQDPGLRGRHGRAARVWAREQFSAPRVAARYLEAFARTKPCPFAKP